jgi:thiol:disulfide interchange protein DsbD
MKLFFTVSILLFFSLFSLEAADFLMPDEAFKPYAKVLQDNQVEVGVEIGKDIYLYADKMSVKVVDTKGVSIADTKLPPTVDHHGDKVYVKSPAYILDLKQDDGAKKIQELTLLVSYQGCSEQGLCYEPYTKKLTLQVDFSQAKNQVLEMQPKLKQEIMERSQTDTIADSLKSGNILMVLLSFFGFGLLLAMTPCVFPMIPIISGLIISQGEGITTAKAFMLSLVYVLAMAVAYTIAGILAGLFGANLQAALQTPWVVYSFSLIFVALAMSMFGFYELKLPDALVNKVSGVNKRSGYVGVAIMGFLSALIVGPCVAAPLAGALVYIGQTGDAVLGGAALFFMSIGMGVPLIVVGVSAGKFMPRPGAWMTMVSAIFGVMMLGVAIWMLEKILDFTLIAGMYAILGLGFSLYLGVFERDGHILKRSVALVMFLYSVALFLGFLAGAPSMTQPLGFLQASNEVIVEQTQSKKLHFQVVTSIEELEKLLVANKGKKIMLDFSADWCTSCKELEEVTLSDTQVKEALSSYILIRADVTQNSANNKALSQKYGVFGPPALIFFDKDLKVMRSKTIIGFIEPQELLAHLAKL